MEQISEIKFVTSVSVKLELKNWDQSHTILVASQASCLVRVPKVTLRFYLQEGKTRYSDNNGNRNITSTCKYYSLCAEVLEADRQEGVINVNANVPITNSTDFAKDGCVALNGLRQGMKKVLIEGFFIVQQAEGCEFSCQPLHCSIPKGLFKMKNITIKLSVTLYDSNGNENNDGLVRNKPTEAEASIIRHLKNMYYLAEDNFSDLKLEAKNGVVLKAHKFQIAARSPIFRRLIEKAVNQENFDGTVKLLDVNPEPLKVILHWMYTGELHEDAGNVMEEVVETSVKYQLGDLLKILDKKLIDICDVDNMFQLFQVAKKNAMPTAVEDIRAFIKENV